MACRFFPFRILPLSTQPPISCIPSFSFLSDLSNSHTAGLPSIYSWPHHFTARERAKIHVAVQDTRSSSSTLSGRRREVAPSFIKLARVSYVLFFRKAYFFISSLTVGARGRGVRSFPRSLPSLSLFLSLFLPFYFILGCTYSISFYDIRTS